MENNQTTDADILNDLVGMATAEARAYLATHLPTYRIRIGTKDGVAQIGTCDFDTHRINLDVENDMIVRIGRLG